MSTQDARLVYRVEHSEVDYGPFTGEGTWTMHEVLADAGLIEPMDETDDAFHSAYRGFPGPGTDPRLSRRWIGGELEDRVCGCRSERELGSWFPPPLAAYLDGQGYELTVWSVPRKLVAHGRNQVMFDRDRAECVARRSVSSLHT